jgi:hypothetical protein
MNRKINQKQTLFVNRRGTIGLALVLVSALLAGCPDTTTPPTPSSNVKAISAANQALIAAVGGGISGMGKPGGSAPESDPQKILNGFDALKKRLSGQGGNLSFKKSSSALEKTTVTDTVTDTIISGGEIGICGKDTLFVGTIAFSGSYREIVDEDPADGTPESDETELYDNFTLKFTETCLETATGIVSTEMVLNGAIAFTDNLDAVNSETAKFSNFTVTFSPTTVNGVKGEAEVYSGSISITTNCLVETTFTISTVVSIFYPDGDVDCPTAGKLLVTGGGVTSAVTFTASGGVQIDEGNNGTIDKTFAHCDDADACKT